MQLRCIQYVLDWPADPEIGVPQKVLSQKKAWENQGVRVDLHVIAPAGYLNAWLKQTNYVTSYNSSRERLKARRQVNRRILQFYKENSTQSIQYRRYGVFSLSDLFTLFRVPTVLEINTNNRFFYSKKSRVLGFVIDFQERLIARFCLGACTVTPELISLQKSNLQKKSRCFTNTISEVRQNVKIIRDWKRPRFLFAGSENFPWNGVARIKDLVTEFPEFDFIVAGPIEIDLESNNLSKLGICSKSRMESLLREVDFGLSTLAMEETGLTEAASLKSRTYLGSGLPVVGGVSDSEIMKIPGIYFQLTYDSNGVKPTNADEFRKFVHHNLGKRIDAEDLVSLSAPFVENRRIQYLDQLLRDRLKTMNSGVVENGEH